jgi:hypothetical protein
VLECGIRADAAPRIVAESPGLVARLERHRCCSLALALLTAAGVATATPMRVR